MTMHNSDSITLQSSSNGNRKSTRNVTGKFIVLHRALMPPKWKKSWHVGVRVASNKRLVAFISGIPADIRTYDV